MENVKHILPYIANGVYAEVKRNRYPKKVENAIITLGDLTGYAAFKDNFTIKPFLRPMELTATITVDGKEIIPIVELAKIYQKGIVWNLNEDKAVYEMSGLKRYFRFDKRYKAFEAYIIPHEFLNEKKHSVVNGQNALFKWLYDNNFDVDGLIEKGLAYSTTVKDYNQYR